ncbi:D-3-phosphoglycerate dehydrogenase [Ancylobacter vacuolatus]|uniref:D-3-phosphoglycerate dehydrogenase n=1 Tax=Ancylobacter vacuolatus TaxID=223389 RepID=A0ABU0DJS5_9HYPH|nr:D-3-phosphoglycerate dehydrogenase [Ancylobacter vacuolatus]
MALQAKSEDDLIEVARDCAAIMNQYARVGARTIGAMENCKVIARYGVGVDIVDVAAAADKGILVTNVRDYCTEEVADHAISLWLALARGLFPYDRATHQGIWRWQSAAPLHRLRGQTVGIVSFGKIGQAIAARASGFGVSIVVCDPYLAPGVAKAHGARQVDKAELLRIADVVMMQVPMTAETRHFLSEAEFRAMKPNALVINTGRGPTIDNRALHRALTEGWIAGAGLDDPEEEPAKRGGWDPADNPIFSLPNVIVTPHAAYYSEESIRAARETAASEVARVLTGQLPRNPVNAVPPTLRA